MSARSNLGQIACVWIVVKNARRFKATGIPLLPIGSSPANAERELHHCHCHCHCHGRLRRRRPYAYVHALTRPWLPLEPERTLPARATMAITRAARVSFDRYTDA
jgi:hypothetical protein